GDRTGVLALLAADVTISEAGHTQTRDEYAAGHLAEDIAFLKTAQITPLSIASMPMGQTAMVGTESEIHANGKGVSTALRSRELLSLKREGTVWKIASIRWQSEPLPG